MRRLLALGLVVLAALAAAPSAGASNVRHIKHVFIIMLENKNYSETFGKNSPAPYLANRLASKGALLKHYYAIAHESQPNYLAMISGQAPNADTQSDCQFYNEFVPGTPAPGGQYIGQGCVYPPNVPTLANQLDGFGKLWKGYMEDMNAAAPPGEEEPCRHPALNQHDDTQDAEPGDQYAARHNPFVYFQSIVDFPTCEQHDVDLSHLHRDLRHERTTPNYSLIVPNLCNDGHDDPCVNGHPGGLVEANGWLRRHVPPILHSPAFHHRGLLMVTFDEAEDMGPHADSSACCHEQPGFNTIDPGGPTPGPGGGRIGAVLVSPCIDPGTVVKKSYNHYSLLRTVERNFHVPYLGYARQKGLDPFGTNVFNDPCNN